VQHYWLYSMIYTRCLRATGRFFMPALVWARTHCSRIRKSLIGGCGLMYSEVKKHLSREPKAISDYRKASGDPEGLAELMVYYCEQAAGFCRDVDHQDAAYCDALVRMFEQALRTTTDLAANSGTVRNRLLGTLDHVRSIGHELGYGIGDDMDSVCRVRIIFSAEGASWR
jgi:hypothetical protein